MTTRERWILYPLLFMTLGMVMRDKVFPQRRFDAQNITTNEVTAYSEITAHRVRCNQLDVGSASCRRLAIADSKGAEGVRMGVVAGGGGWLELCGAAGKKVVVAGADETGQSGVVETLGPDEVPQVQLWANESGGAVTAVSRDRDTWLVLEHTKNNYGVFVESPKLGRRILLTLPWRLDVTPSPDERQPESAGQRPEPSDQQPPQRPDDNPPGTAPGGSPGGGLPGGGLPGGC